MMLHRLINTLHHPELTKQSADSLRLGAPQITLSILGIAEKERGNRKVPTHMPAQWMLMIRQSGDSSRDLTVGLMVTFMCRSTLSTWHRMRV